MEFKEMFLNHLRYQKRYSSHTLKSYETDLDQFIEFCKQNKQNIEEADHTDIRHWIVGMMENNVSARSVNRKLSSLKSYYRFLIREGLVSKNPLDKVVAPKIKKRLPVFVEEDQIQSLLDTVDFGEGWLATRNHLIIDMFYRTGIRLSELINLKDKDVDVRQFTIKVLGKRNKERIIPFSPDFVRNIELYREERNRVNDSNETFFLGLKGKKMYEKEVYRVVQKYLSKVTTLEKEKSTCDQAYVCNTPVKQRCRFECH